MQMKKKVIFIGGSSYSGSTMLDMMLSNTKSGFSVGEVYAMFRPFRPHHFKPLCGCGDLGCKLWVKIKDKGENNLYQSIFEEFPEIDYIVDSSKDPLWINQQINNLSRQEISAYNILIWKDAISFCASMIKRNKKNGINAWVNYHRLYLSLICEWIPISYSDLAQNSPVLLNKLCKKIGINYEEGMENYWNKQHHTLFGNDSAKVHLSKSIDDYKIQDKKNPLLSSKEQKNNKDSHRSIYYNVDNSMVSKEIQNEINSNPMINLISKKLLCEDIIKEKATEETEVKFSPYKLTTIKLIASVKRYIGRSIGRYYRVF
jgi:hypothetical protein